MAGTCNISQIALTTDFASTHSLHSSDGGNDDHITRSNRFVDDNDQQVTSPKPESFAPSALAPHPHSGGLQPIHTWSPSDPTLLLPFSMLPTSPTGGRTSLDMPYSPSPSYVSSNEGSSMMAPPSPTLYWVINSFYHISGALR